MNSPASGKTLFSTELQGNVLIVSAQAEINSLQSDIDQQMADVLNKFKECGATHLLLDLTRSSYFGTAMLGGMVKVWKKVSQGGGQMLLCNVSEGIQEVLKLTKLHTLWPVFSDRETAINSFRR